MQDIKHLQAYDSYRCSNSIPLPIPLLAVRHPLNILYLSGWRESQPVVQTSSHIQSTRDSSGTLTAEDDRALLFLVVSDCLCFDSAKYPLALPNSSSPLDGRCPYHFGFESWPELLFIEFSFMPVSGGVSHGTVQGGCFCLSCSPAFPSYWH